MTDKLPTIYLPLFDGKIDTSDSEPEMARAFARKADALIEHPSGEIAAYEPAVPRCRTCDHHSVGQDSWAFCARLRKLLNKSDGSGYCSEHPEARR